MSRRWHLHGPLPVQVWMSLHTVLMMASSRRKNVTLTQTPPTSCRVPIAHVPFPGSAPWTDTSSHTLVGTTMVTDSSETRSWCAGLIFVTQKLCKLFETSETKFQTFCDMLSTTFLRVKCCFKFFSTYYLYFQARSHSSVPNVLWCSQPNQIVNDT